jgi:hypothetical protein
MVAPTTPRLTLREPRTSTSDAVRPDRGDRRTSSSAGNQALRESSWTLPHREPDALRRAGGLGSLKGKDVWARRTIG